MAKVYFNFYGQKLYRTQLEKMAKTVLSQPSETLLELNTPDYHLAYWFLLRRADHTEYHHPPQLKLMCPDGKFNCFAFLNINNDWIPYSYRKALSSDEQNDKRRITEALRIEIKDQILQFKADNFYEYLATDEHLHIDHIYPFSQLVDDFLKKQELKLNDIAVKFDEHFWQPILVDRSLAKKWKDYHKENAKLQLLTAKKNLSKGKKY